MTMPRRWNKAAHQVRLPSCTSYHFRRSSFNPLHPTPFVLVPSPLFFFLLAILFFDPRLGRVRIYSHHES